MTLFRHSYSTDCNDLVICEVSAEETQTRFKVALGEEIGSITNRIVKKDKLDVLQQRFSDYYVMYSLTNEREEFKEMVLNALEKELLRAKNSVVKAEEHIVKFKETAKEV